MKIKTLVFSVCLVLVLTLFLISNVSAAVNNNFKPITNSKSILKSNQLWSQMGKSYASSNSILVYDVNLTPLYYLVTVKKNKKIVGLSAIDAKTGDWQWFVKSNLSNFLNVDSKKANSIIKKAKIKGTRPGPLLISAGDKELYWYFKTKNAELFISSSTGLSYNRTQLNLKINSTIDMKVSTPKEVSSSNSVKKISSSEILPLATQTPITALEIPSSYNLNVPFHYQENSYFCAEAALQMVFDYLGPITSQSNIGKVANAINPSGTYPTDLNRAALFSNISSAIQDSNLKGYPEWSKGYLSCYNFWEPSISQVDYDNRYNDLKKIILAGYPIIISTWYDSGHSTGHSRVLKGYDDVTNSFIVHDPWYSGAYQGPDVYFNQIFLVDNLWTNSYRWGMVVEPLPINITSIFNATSRILEIKAATHGYCSVFPSSGHWYAPYYDYGYGDLIPNHAKMKITLPSEFSLIDGDNLVKYGDITNARGENPVLWKINAPNIMGNFTFQISSDAGMHNYAQSYNPFYDVLGSIKNYSISLEKTPIVCSSDSDCGNEGVRGDLFCEGGNVYQNYTSFTCNNPGTVESFCSSSTMNLLNQTCLFACYGGNCLPKNNSFSWCYQESANSPNLNDGLCTLDYKGRYAFSPIVVFDNISFGSYDYLFINYTKPAFATNNSLWKVKHGNFGTYSINIPLSCWNYNERILFFRLYSGSVSRTNLNLISYGECLSNTGWITITNSREGWGGTINGGQVEPTLIYDGNWDTYVLMYIGKWLSGAGGDLTAGVLYEEAMNWSLSTDNCYDNRQCDDGNFKTLDACENIGTSQSYCSHQEIVCSTDLECDDGDISTVDTCINPSTIHSYCKNKPRLIKLCYQETANQSNPNDNGCRLNYDGSYSFDGNYFYINYSKPPYVEEAIWRVKHGPIEDESYNVTIPPGCFAYSKNKILLRFYSEYLYPSLSYGECYDGITWQSITSLKNKTPRTVVNSWSKPVEFKSYDGNWATGIAWAPLMHLWIDADYISGLERQMAIIWEEAIIWVVPKQTQIISLSTGWNTLQFTVLPENKTLQNVLSSIDGKYSQVKTMEDGQMKIWDETLPDFANDLIEIKYDQEYLINMKENSTITIVGDYAP